MHFPLLFAALVLPLSGQIVLQDSFDTEETGINLELPARQAAGSLRLQWIKLPQTDTSGSAGIDNNQAQFQHDYTGTSTTNVDSHSVWTLSANGTTPYNLAPQIGGKTWTLTFNASVNGSTTTDRMRVIVQDSVSPSIGDNASLDIGWQLSIGTSTASAQGVKLRYNNLFSHWPDATTASNGQTPRSYAFTVDETASYAMTSSVDGTPFAAGTGSLTGFTTASRYLFIHLWDRQVSTIAPPNLIGTLDSITLETQPLGPPINSFTATTPSIIAGQSSTLNWSVTGATSLSLSDGSTPTDVTGTTSLLVSPSVTTTYTLTATNGQGVTTKALDLIVSPPVPVITRFTATPPVIAPGGSSLLQWNVTGANTVTLSPGAIPLSANGSLSVPPSSPTTYTLTATNPFGPATAETSVSISNGTPPNFLFIAIDDLKPLCGFMSENPGNFLNQIYPDSAKRAQIRKILTPNIDRLAAEGIGFHRAYCAASVCRPSRTALITGYRPNESGVTGNDDGYFRAADKPAFLRTVTTLPQHLRDNGYLTAGSGKILHTGSDEETDYNGVTINGIDYSSWTTWFPNSPSTGNQGNKVKSLYSPTGIEIDFGYDSGPLNGQGDYATADLIARMFEENTVSYNGRSVSLSPTTPFFLACGIFRPHLPLYMPKEILDLFDVNDIHADQAMLDAFAADLNDITGGGSLTGGDMGSVLGTSPAGKLGGIPAYKETIRHYLAAAALADRCVKRVVEALEASPYKNNTIVVLWSDHGWYLGEKLLFRKTQLWDEASNCNLVIRDPRPGMQAPPGTPCYRTVSLQDLYPTIASLAGLPKPSHVVGYDISPLLKNPARPWNIPAQTSMGDVAIRYGRWSYLKRSTRELYDVANDPDEITNLAQNPAYDAIETMMDNLLTRSIANDSFPERADDSYDNWRLGTSGWFVGDGAKLAPTGNPDNDTSSNLAEYYFATDPNLPDAFGPPPPMLSGPPAQMSIRFNIRDLDPALEYKVLSSATLNPPWTPIWRSKNPAQLDAATISGAGTGVRTVEVSTPVDSDQKFLRIEVSQ